MDTKELGYFLVLADKLSYKKAADSLYISKSSLSRSISGLEKELGVRLFDRSTRSVTLTEEGRACIKSARVIMDELKKMSEKMTEMAANPAGSIKIGCYFHGSQELIYEVVYGFRKKYRDITANITMEDIPELIRQLEKNDLDMMIALRSVFDGMDSIEMETLLPGQLYAVLPEKHPAAAAALSEAAAHNSAPSLELDSLTGDKIFIHSSERSEPVRNIMKAYLISGGISEKNISMEKLDNMAALVRVSLGEGVLVLPAYGLQNEIASDKTVNLPIRMSDEDRAPFDEVIVRKVSNHNRCCDLFMQDAKKGFGTV